MSSPYKFKEWVRLTNDVAAQAAGIPDEMCGRCYQVIAAWRVGDQWRLQLDCSPSPNITVNAAWVSPATEGANCAKK